MYCEYVITTKQFIEATYNHIALSHLILYFLGHLEADQFLTGIQETAKPISRFHTLLIVLLFTSSILSSLLIVAKKLEANSKDKKMIKALNIMIKNSEEEPKQKLNNGKHNQPIVNLFVLVLFVLMFIGLHLDILCMSTDLLLIISKVFGWVGLQIFFFELYFLLL